MQHDICKTPKRIYLAGPMRGYAEFNFPAFFKQAEELRAAGHFVFNPAERDTQRGFDPTGLKGTMEELRSLAKPREALAADTEFICKDATHIFMLPGWSKSSGARAENALALALGLEVEGSSE